LSSGRSLTLIGLAANFFGAILIAKFYRDECIVVSEEETSLSAKWGKTIAIIGWFLFIGGFFFQIVDLLIEP
jgi:hypothetical protein